MVKTKKTVDISDAAVSRNPNEVIVTYSLGSCVGVSLYDPATKIGGMLHYQLPESKLDPEKAKRLPFMFADTGIKLLVDKMVSMGASKKRMNVKIAGGAAMSTGPKGFDIGKRNHLAIRKVFWKLGMFIDAEDIGGTSPRNMYLDIADGTLTVRCVGRDKKL
ncbi:Chemoreceptor glutamine deamidase CheD [Anaerohalosphaera lusitana]|uniref:Probable chemoreceptor glutamine deamidase CheD n=1 Tax=Anaerohalosphaera lusitana TaxID=1936003 RepID=A0A1U9NGJ3_9BACT|nr:chemotaxis protein CheD [Anaerohalosphaera lusitana]AQT66877.1 Chemoreceptor glutamine deamidase CheD [Anaerohalosphaera lusitana]